MLLKRAKGYVEGIGCPQSWEHAFAIYERLATAGVAEAQYRLANCYRHGIVVEPNTENALDLFFAAAKSGHKQARFEIGVAHFAGDFQGDGDQAVAWITQLAEEGHVRAQAALGWWLKQSKRITSAFEWFERAARQGSVQAMVQTAICYRDVDHDYPRAEDWLRKAAALGHHDALFELGNTLQQQKKLEEAFGAFLEGANKGHPRCQNMVGWKLRNGNGVATNHAQAVLWYEKAAFQQNGAALWNLALLYDSGNGVPLDKVKAYYLYRQSADAGYACAQAYCAVALVDVDPQESDDYLVLFERNPFVRDSLTLLSSEERSALLVLMLNKPPPFRLTGLTLFDLMAENERVGNRELLQAAAGAGSTWALGQLALTHLMNNDEKQALELYNKALQIDGGKCVCEVKKLLRTHTPFAVNVLERASREGVVEAAFELGAAYESIPSVFNMDKALECYKRGSQSTACARRLAEQPFCLLTPPTRSVVWTGGIKVSGLSLLGTTVIRHMFAFMDGTSLCNASAVCKHFHANASHAQLDPHWRSIFFNEFGPCLTREDKMLSCGVVPHPGHGSLWGPTAPLSRGHCGMHYSDLFRLSGMLRAITTAMRPIDSRYLQSHPSTLGAHLLVMPQSFKQQLRATCVRSAPKRARLDAAVQDLESVIASAIHFCTGRHVTASKTSWEAVFARPISMWHTAMHQAQFKFPLEPRDSPSVRASAEELFRQATGLSLAVDFERYAQTSRRVCDLLEAAFLSAPFQLMESTKRIDRVIGCGVLRSGDLCVVSCGSWWDAN
jgi:TPR repeat protein